MMKMDVVLVGVGGQGTLLASRILGALAIGVGADVKVSEVHGMAQRGGSVVTFVRIGADVRSPIVEAGGADYVVAFEQMEAARAVEYLKPDGTMILNTQKMPPMPVITGAATYPADLIKRLHERVNAIAIDAFRLAADAGEERAVNLVLLGAMCALVKGDQAAWRAAVTHCVPKRLLEVNLKAFEAGYNSI